MFEVIIVYLNIDVKCNKIKNGEVFLGLSEIIK